MGGVNIPLPALDLQQSQPIDPLAEQMRAAQLKQQAATTQATLAQTQGEQQKNQIQAMQLKDEQLSRSLMSQFAQKDASGKVTGFDREGWYNAMLSQGVAPAFVDSKRMEQIKLQQSLLDLSDHDIEHQHKIKDEAFNAIQAVRDANKQGTPAQPNAPPSSAPPSTSQPTLGPAVPGTGGMPAAMLPNMPEAKNIGKAAPGSPESLGQPTDGTAPTATESALQNSSAAAPRPINAKGQIAYHNALMDLSRMHVPIGQFPPVLHDESELDEAAASLGLHAQLLKENAELAKTSKEAGEGAKGQAEAKKAEWIGSDGTFANIRTGQMIHAGGSPSLQAFQQYISKGGDPLNFASDQAAREASNPALQAAKLHLVTMEKSAEQAIADGDPKAAAQLLVSGSVAPSQLISSRKPAFAQAAFTAAKQLDPKWDATKADADYKVASSPTNVAFFGSAKSLTDKGGTLDQLAAAGKDIPQNEFKPFNTIEDAWKTSVGSGPMAKYAAIALGVADDYSKVMGGGQGSDTSRTQALHIIGAKLNPKERAAALDGVRGAVGSQTKSRIGNNGVLKKMYGEESPTNDFFSQFGGKAH